MITSLPTRVRRSEGASFCVVPRRGLEPAQILGCCGVSSEPWQTEGWEQIPDSDKGSGKFYRKAEPGGWRVDLSPDQIGIIEDVTGPILSKYY